MIADQIRSWWDNAAIGATALTIIREEPIVVLIAWIAFLLASYLLRRKSS